MNLSKTPGKRKRYSAEEKNRLLTAYEQRTQTQAEFCQEQGLSTATLGVWLRQNRRVEARTGFVELTDAVGQQNEGSLYLALPGGTVLRVAVGTDTGWLREVLGLLRCGA